jgi:hypothetical protein
MNTAFCAGLVMFALGAAPVGIALFPRDGEPMAVISAPWAPPGAALKSALEVPGALISLSRDGRTVIWVPDTPDAAAKLYQAGAALVVRAGDLSACTSRTPISPAPLTGPASKGTRS